MISFANCKINLGLDILSRRPDGYHDIETVMIPVRDFCDVVEIVRNAEGTVEFSSSGLDAGCDPKDNLCVRACELVRERYPDIGGVKIHLHKTVPSGAGLGGGSSDAASVIKLMNDIFALGMDAAAMESLAAELGSDTAFFVRNAPSLASGKGELLTPLDIDLSGYYAAIINPPFRVSTASAYAAVSPRGAGSGIREIVEGDIYKWKYSLQNGFEPTVFAGHPELSRIKEAFYDAGAVYASMSGSGSAMYGIFRGTPPADAEIVGRSRVFAL